MANNKANILLILEAENYDKYFSMLCKPSKSFNI